jgi:hypothetical protein
MPRKGREVGMKHHQKLPAQMLFLDGTSSPTELARQERDLRAKATKANAWLARTERASSDVIMLAASN